MPNTEEQGNENFHPIVPTSPNQQDTNEPTQNQERRSLENTFTQLANSTIDSGVLVGDASLTDAAAEQDATPPGDDMHTIDKSIGKSNVQFSDDDEVLQNGVVSKGDSPSRKEKMTLHEQTVDSSPKKPATPPDSEDAIPVKKPTPTTHTTHTTTPSPAPETHWFFKIFFCFYWSFEWMTLPVLKGIFTHPEVEDLPSLPKSMQAQNLNSQLRVYWKKYKDYPRPLLWCVARLIWKEYFLAGLANFMMRTIDLCIPLMLREMLKILQYSDSSELWKGYCWAMGIGLLKLIWSVVFQYHLHYAVKSGLKARSGLIGLLYEKSLCVQRKQESVLTLISVDAMKIDIAFQFFHFSWTSIYSVTVCLIFLAFLLKWATFAGLVVILCIIPVQYVAGKLSTTFQSRALAWTDKRVKAIDEIIGGIQLMKFYAWENEYFRRVTSRRNSELKQLLCVNVTRAINTATMSIVPVLVSTVSFTMFALIEGGDELKVEVVFAAMAFYNLLRLPLTYFPIIVNNTVNANVSFKRMERYMKEVEIQPDAVQHGVIGGGYVDAADPPDAPHAGASPDEALPLATQSSSPHKKQPQHTQIVPSTESTTPLALKAINATFEWPFQEDAPKKKRFSTKKHSTSTDDMTSTSGALQEAARIENLNFEIPKGKLVLVVGEVGSGKSSLLAAALGEMKRLEGEMHVNGSIAYVPQTAFLKNATLRENITFSHPFDPVKYQETIHYSGLEEDLQQLNGDLTEIGSRGVNLSGGQQMRTCLARSIYADRDIYMLDDCLAALDASVGRFIFDETIKGYLGDKTRIMVTHALSYCEFADHIIVMDKGSIAEQGSYEELMQSKDGVLAQLIEEHVLVDEYPESENEDREDEDEVFEEPQEENPPQVGVQFKDSPDDEKKNLPTENAAGGSTIIQKEERKKGRISPKVFLAYARAMGGIFVGFYLLMLYIVGQFFLNAPDVWLSLWSGKTIDALVGNTTVNLIVYASLGLVAGLITVFRDVNFYVWCLNASRRLHERAFNRILFAPMSWFEAQPMARIISRFSGDVDLTDMELIQNMGSACIFFFQAIAICVIICVSTSGIFIPALIVIVIFYLILSDVYMRSSREFKRLDSITRSPMMSFFSETIHGLTTIRAYKLQEQFRKDQLKKLNTNFQAYYMLQACTRWLSIRLDIIGAALIFLISVCAFLVRDLSLISPSLLALGITYSLQFNRVMSWFIRNASLAEVNLNSVERLSHYASKQIPNEAALRSSKRPPKNWPTQGAIEFQDMHFRYRPELEDTLKGMNLKIEGGQHVAIVGRTGSGKSSTILSLFRERELSGGRILIDGVDISTIGLHDLREQLTIIPQTPTCFSGSVKSNLDPFGIHTDAKLWDALDKAYLRELVEKLGGLNATIEEGGANLSIGERALLVLARALLRKGKILISDEASAAMSLDLDQKIQETIRKHFSNCTSITIAHRIQTIIDSDIIVVLGAGEIIEKASPAELLRDPNTVFFQMVKDTGESSQRKLMHLALGDDFEEVYGRFRREGKL